MAADLYELLGVSRDASQEEIKRAYRRRARELHPDANGGDPEAEARFKEVVAAYEVLSDPERRRRYDLYGTTGSQADVGFGGGIGDIFDLFFGGSPFGGTGAPGGPPRGADLEVVVDVTFEQAVFGANVPVSVRTAVPCAACEATGADRGSLPERCPDCGGTGQVRRVRQSILGQMMTASSCARCGGLGTVIRHPCPTCGGEGRTLEDKTYQVEVPAGVDTGATLRLTGRGAAGPRGGGIGDLYVHVRVLPHARFTRQGDDLHADLHISFTQAALGAQVSFETLDGEEVLTIAPGTQSGEVLRLRGLGVPHVKGRGRGDLFVRILVDTPTDLSAEEEELLRAFAELRGDEVAPPPGGLLSRMRSAFK
ncbi:MAG: molecular chaperone DnaJ [Acidimicrobiales bacterium]